MDSLRVQLRAKSEEAAKAGSARDNMQAKLAEALSSTNILRLENDLLRVENYRLRHEVH